MAISVLPHIVVIGMGGTIGMSRDADGYLRPSRDVEDIASFIPSASKYAHLTLIPLEALDSTNITPRHWMSLISKIKELEGHCDGILVLHGTDTMAYTATATSFAFPKGCSCPIVFTGSQLPVASDYTDAGRNILSSLMFLRVAIQRNMREVAIVFGEKVLRANRSLKTSEVLFPAFDSPAYHPLAHVTAAGIRILTTEYFKHPDFTRADKVKLFDGNILTIDMVPGLRPDLIHAIVETGECHGLILRSLGTGNVPNKGPYSLITAIQEATANGVPVLVATKFQGGFTRMNMYEPGREALEVGAIPTGDMTDVAAQVKLMAGLGLGLKNLDAIRNWITTDWAGEITPQEDLVDDFQDDLD